MRQALFALAALAATAAVIALPFVAFRLLAGGRTGWFWGVVAIIVLTAIVFLARRR
jgi:predicted membrane-bound dolichyl-phosphate-mannose-protein mannosyltransferase